jgi:hypothetical protein
MEVGRYYTMVFLDILQASDKVWHDDLLYKIKNRFPSDLYADLIKSYLRQNFYS